MMQPARVILIWIDLVHGVSKKLHPFYCCDIFDRFHPLLDSYLMCRLRIRRRRPTVCGKNRRGILHGTVGTYETRCGCLCICVCSKFPGVCFCQKLAKSDEI